MGSTGMILWRSPLFRKLRKEVVLTWVLWLRVSRRRHMGVLSTKIYIMDGKLRKEVVSTASTPTHHQTALLSTKPSPRTSSRPTERSKFRAPPVSTISVIVVTEVAWAWYWQGRRLLK